MAVFIMVKIFKTKEQIKEENERDEETISSGELFYPGIDNFLQKVDNVGAVSVKDLEKILLKIVSHTGFEKKQIERFLDTLLQEIRLQLIKQRPVAVQPLGFFYIKYNKNKSNYSIEFRPSPKLLKQMNGKRKNYRRPRTPEELKKETVSYEYDNINFSDTDLL